MLKHKPYKTSRKIVAVLTRGKSTAKIEPTYPESSI
jgi:hypothetical protein